MTTQFSLASLNGANGFGLFSNTSNDQFGTFVKGGFDFNGDGLKDFLAGTNSSAAYIFYGKSTPFLKSYVPQSFNGTEGVVIQGPKGSNLFANSGAGIGDVNGDGYDDVAIGSSDEDVNGLSSTGKVYVFFGGPSVPSPLLVENMDGKTGVVISGASQQGQFGFAVSDVNGDKKADLAIGAPGANNYAGKAYVVFGQEKAPALFKLTALDGKDGYGVDATNDQGWFGGSVANGRDVNSDGYDEVIVSAAAGEWGDALVIYGKAGGYSPSYSYEHSALIATNSFIMQTDCLSYDPQSGQSVVGAGDVNGDGKGDVLYGAPGGFAPTNFGFDGNAYLLLGSDSLNGTRNDMCSINNGIAFTPYASKQNEHIGWSNAFIDDVNGDGLNDMAISAPCFNEGGGIVFVVLGSMFFGTDEAASL